MTTERTPRPPAKSRVPTRVEAGVRSALTDAMARLRSRGPRSDGDLDRGAAPAMSDAELREAFRVASLTVTPAPLGRAGRHRGGGAADDPRSPAEPRPDRDGSPTDDGVPRPTRPAASAAASAASTQPAHAAGAEPAGVRWATGSARLTGAPPSPVVDGRLTEPPVPGERSATEEHGEAGADPGSFTPRAGPHPTDPPGLPGNLAASADDFFDGLVRRVERRA